MSRQFVHVRADDGWLVAMPVQRLAACVAWWNGTRWQSRWPSAALVQIPDAFLVRERV